MTHPPSRAILTAAAIVTLLNAYTPTPTEPASPALEEVSMSTQQKGAPYPSDLGHFDDTLALGKTALSEGTANIAITPATKFAESYPGDWGYVIAYHADPQPIRNHIDTYASHSGDNIEDYLDTGPPFDIEDIDVANIQHPWVTGFGKVQIVIERPLGRCWPLTRDVPC